MHIHQLPPDVVSKIAAGEVIERPASVAKELLENAVDAGSHRIDVEVENGGTDLVRVVDDGSGVAAEELPLAFARHATSKLTTADDLFRVGTLGFRGEALASIGGVAQVRLQSRPAGCPAGAEIICNGATMSPVRVWNGAPGTRIEVRHLFFNTPVRRKFLRTIGTEMGHVCETFTRLALAQPGLHLTLRHNGKQVYEVPAATSLAERVVLFFGGDMREQLYAVEATEGPASLHGLIADPACNRGNAKLQYLFVNGRWIRDRSLAHAVQEAYRGLLMTGRYAVTFLFLQLPPDLVDVNVHPTKSEVRFRDGHQLYHLVFQALRDRLRRANLTPRLQAPSLGIPSMAQRLPSASFAEPSAFPPASAPPGTSRAVPEEEQGRSVRPAIGSEASAGATGVFKAIQLYDAYLVLETPEGMLVIDQHALHERILFEQLKRRLRAGPPETQRLLIPEPVDLPAEQAARTLEHRTALTALGLEVEDFGGGTLLLTSYPAILGSRPPAAILRAVVDYLVSKDRPPNQEQMLNDLLSLMACHAAVRAGDHLTPEEIAALVAERDLAADTHHCPHGRPTSLLFSRQELERQFRRT